MKTTLFLLIFFGTFPFSANSQSGYELIAMTSEAEQKELLTERAQELYEKIETYFLKALEGQNMAQVLANDPAWEVMKKSTESGGTVLLDLKAHDYADELTISVYGPTDRVMLMVKPNHDFVWDYIKQKLSKSAYTKTVKGISPDCHNWKFFHPSGSGKEIGEARACSKSDHGRAFYFEGNRS